MAPCSACWFFQLAISTQQLLKQISDLSFFNSVTSIYIQYDKIWRFIYMRLYDNIHVSADMAPVYLHYQKWINSICNENFCRALGLFVCCFSSLACFITNIWGTPQRQPRVQHLPTFWWAAWQLNSSPAYFLPVLVSEELYVDFSTGTQKNLLVVANNRQNL